MFSIFNFQTSTFNFQPLPEVRHYKTTLNSRMPECLNVFNFQLSIFNFQFSTFNFQLSIFNFQFSTFNFQLSTFNFQFLTFKLQFSTFNFQPLPEVRHYKNILIPQNKQFALNQQSDPELLEGKCPKNQSRPTKPFSSAKLRSLSNLSCFSSSLKFTS